jgi:hypothetical protein
MRASLRTVAEPGVTYQSLLFRCPGCEEFGGSGHHMLPVNSAEKSPSWEWNGSLDAPTLSPSILSRRRPEQVCHSFLRDGVFEFLGDCTHSLVGQSVPMPDLEWDPA